VSEKAVQEKARHEMTFASLVTFVQVLFFAAIFLLFISGSVGWTLVYAFLLALVISVVTLIISHGRYTVETERFSGVTSVGEECAINVTVRKMGFCIIPYLTLEGSFCGQSFTVKTALLLRDHSTVTIKLRPTECGLQKAVVSMAYSEDLLWILRLKKRCDVSAGVAVLPRVVEYTGPQVTPSVLPSDNERCEEGASVMFGGAPGYEHREYADGDTPRRINYKLSAKKQRLMVRLDESTGTESTNILLDSGADGGCLEQAFALAQKLVMKGSPVTVLHGKDSFEATSPATVHKLREWLAFRDTDSAVQAKLPAGTVCVMISPMGISVKS